MVGIPVFVLKMEQEGSLLYLLITLSVHVAATRCLPNRPDRLGTTRLLLFSVDMSLFNICVNRSGGVAREEKHKNREYFFPLFFYTHVCSSTLEFFFLFFFTPFL